jgi:3-oxoacyl-(acyl-carrier-protein) synthase
MRYPQDRKRVAITGMSVISTLGDTLETVHSNLLQGKSGIKKWKTGLYAGSCSRFGGDLSEYNVDEKIYSLRNRVPDGVSRRMEKLCANAPRAARLGMPIAVEAFLDAGLFGMQLDPERISTILAGQYMYELCKWANWEAYSFDPDSMAAAHALMHFDYDLSGCITEILGLYGPSYSNGGACAAGIIAIRNAVDEIRHHDSDIVLVAAATHEPTPAYLYSLAKLGAISIIGFDDEPHRASRPFDVDRNGFVPGIGCAALIIEEMDHALRRGARIYAEIAGIGINSNASRSPTPIEDCTVNVMERALHDAGIAKEEIDYISAHATSTQIGDINEIRALKRVFGNHARNLKINAPKSMMGHQLWASALIEIVVAILQMRAGVLYPTINIDRLESEIDLDICANHAVQYAVNYLMKNAFGFGGINSSCILRQYA